MPSDVIPALKRAQLAARAYAYAWVAFIVAWLALPIAVPVFDLVLEANDQQVGVGLLAGFALAAFPLPLIADAALCAALASLARACGRKTVHPAVVALLALTLPFIATAVAVSAAREAVSGIERAPTLPSTRWTLWVPIVAWFLSAAASGFMMSMVEPHDEGPNANRAIVSLVVVLFQALPFGICRVILGLKLRSAFAEILARPAVDDMHARHTEPVAGG